jgi:hypothetical protein
VVLDGKFMAMGVVENFFCSLRLSLLGGMFRFGEFISHPAYRAAGQAGSVTA